MRILDRYVARTVWMSILLVLLVIVGIDALSAFIDEAEKRSDSYGFAQIGQYILYSLPGRVYEFIPFAALIGSLIGLGQLASSSELVVMRASGVSNARLARTVLAQAVFLAAVGFLLGEYLAPVAEQRAQSGRSMALYADERIEGDQGIWRRDGRTFMHVRAVADGGRVFGATLYHFAADGRLGRLVFADRGVYQRNGWSLSDVRVTEFGDESVRAQGQDALFVASNVTPRILALENVAPSQLALDDLLDYTRFLRSQGEDVAAFELATWRKLSQPLSVAALVLVAISFVFGPLREGTMGFRIFAGVMVGVLFRLGQDLLGPSSLVFGFPPLYAALLPVLVCIGVGTLLLRRA